MSRIARAYLDGTLKLVTVRFWREATLTLGAALGVICMVLAVASIGFGVKPLIFQSGSMSPTITTGALAFAKSQPATNLKVGDIVSVKDAEGTRVTHRIATIAQTGVHATLTLRGDANPTADSHPYGVDRADRVFFYVPKLGYVVSWISGPIGIFFGGLLCGLLLFVVFWPKRHVDSRGVADGRRKNTTKRRIPVGLLVLGLVGAGSVGIAGANPTWATFTDTAAVSTAGFSADYLRPPTGVKCSPTGFLGLGPPRIDWTAPSKGPLPVDYLITVSKNEQSQTFGPQASTSFLIANGLITLLKGTQTVTIQSHKYSDWYSQPSKSVQVTTILGLGGLISIASCK